MGRLAGGALLAAVLAAGLVAVSEAQAQRRGGNTSAYTDLDLDRCRQTSSSPEEGGSATWQCPGYGGVPLLVAEGDLRFDIDAGVDSGQFETGTWFSTLGPRVEWRLRGRQPVAIIYRLVLSGDNRPKRNVLGVETIGRAGRPGCIIAWIAGSAPNSNLLARQQADARGASFRCGRDKVAAIGELEGLVPVDR